MSWRKLMPVDVWPVVGVVGLGCAGSVYMLFRYLAIDKDIYLVGRQDGHQRITEKPNKPHFLSAGEHHVLKLDPATDVFHPQVRDSIHHKEQQEKN